MEISNAQAEKHGKNYADYKQAYLDGRESKKSLEDIAGDKRRCITLVHELGKETPTYELISRVSNFLRGTFSGLYVQDIPHFTIDCHRYIKEPAEGQKIITPEEFDLYNQILKEEIGSLNSFPFKVQGVSFGSDGLVAQVWYNPEILINFNDKLGKKVRAEVPSMDFEWGMAKGKVPIRVINLARFTGEEDKGKIERFVEHLKGINMGEQNMNEMSLLESDHYIQKKNTQVLGRYLLGY
jgi:hypothetical protein